MPGQALINEGDDVNSTMYLIYEGELLLTVNQNTLRTDIKAGKLVNNGEKVSDEGRLFIPKSIQTFQLGYRKSGEWLHDE